MLRLSNADILAKSLTLPLATQPELRQVLSFEMDQETPFKPDELYWDHRLETTVMRRPGTPAASALDAGLDVYGFRNHENLVAAKP